MGAEKKLDVTVDVSPKLKPGVLPLTLTNKKNKWERKQSDENKTAGLEENNYNFRGGFFGPLRGSTRIFTRNLYSRTF